MTERKQVSADAIVEEVTDPEYDGLGRLVSEQRYDGKIVRYEYDAKGNRKKVTDPDQVATEYGYDALDRLETATTPAGEASYRYWPDGRVKGTSLPSGLEEARCYDPAGGVVAIVTAKGAIGEGCANPAQLVSRFDYGYDVNGNRTSQLERRTAPGSGSVGAAEETTYGYDAQDRLVGVAYPDKTVLYQLDAVGNRTGERVRPAAGVLALTVAAFTSLGTTGLTSDLTATFNRADWVVAQMDAVDATRSATYGYDLAGNLTDKVKGSLHRRLRWSYRGTLTAVLDGQGTGAPVEVGRYDYDADQQRVKRTTAQEQVEYVLDDRHVLQEASSAAGHPAYRRYHYAQGPLLVDDAAGRRFISTDALGSTTDLTTTGATVASMRKHDAWGQYRNDTAPAASEPKLGFTGHQYDPETGLVYARARYYDADLGRFLSRDSYEGTISDAPSLHRFTYVRGNPLRYTDPSGLREMSSEEAARDAEWVAAQAQAKAAWAAMPWYRQVADFLDSSGSRETSRILARNINAYRWGIAQAADGEAVAKIDVAAEYGEGPGTVKLPSGEQELSRQPLIVPVSKFATVQAQRRLNRETLDAVTAGPAASTSYAIADAAGATAETKANVAKTVAHAESTAYVARAFAPGSATAELKANIAREAGTVTGVADAPRFRSVGAAAANDPALVSAEPQVARFEVTPSGRPGTEVVQRAMSVAELQATETSGLLRGGRSGTHYVSDAANSDALRARQRLALGQTPEVRVTLEVPTGAFSPPTQVTPLNGMPGGGMERTATGLIRVKVIRTDVY